MREDPQAPSLFGGAVRDINPQGATRVVAPRANAAVDLTGTWVSVITEMWEYRMVTARKGGFITSATGAENLPANVEALRIANTWDPAKDEAAGEQCRGYGAVGGSRLPGKLRISWQDDTTLKMELEAGNQVRLFHFGNSQPPAGAPTWQGFSTAEWEYSVAPRGQPRKGDLKVDTTRLRPGYSVKNGLPYSANTHLTEYFHRMTIFGEEWITLISELRDPQYYRETWVLSSHFKKVPEDSPRFAWKPEPCSAK